MSLLAFKGSHAGVVSGVGAGAAEICAEALRGAAIVQRIRNKHEAAVRIADTLRFTLLS